MSTHQSLESSMSMPAISKQQVEEFLRDNPDFFEDHMSLLASLQIPHPSGSAVSLIERQVGVLREQNRSYQRKLMELVQVGRDNDKVNRHLHQLTLSLFRSKSFQDVIDAVLDSLCNEFYATHIALRLAGMDEIKQLPEEVASLSSDDPELAAFQAFFQTAKPACNPLKPGQMQYLFGDNARKISSTALVPLGEGCRFGILAIGSDDPQRFHPAMDTLFLRNLGDLTSAALEPWLHIPENIAS